MQCSVTVQRGASGNIMKTNSYTNPYRKEPNLDNIVDQLCTRLQHIKDKENPSQVGMPTCTLEYSEAVRRYYAAFPALKKGQESPQQYYLPPPAWCRKPAPDPTIKMQSELSMSKDWNINKNKKLSTGRERRNSYHGQKKNKKRNNSYSKSSECKESLPEWVTHEGVWDMEAQDPVKEFIRAIALDEGYGTCENTVTEEIKEITQMKIGKNENIVPDWDDSLDLDSEWIINDDLKPRVLTPMEEELYAKFEAKFDRSIEALWSKERQNTPDDEYQELPIDFQELLSSPAPSRAAPAEPAAPAPASPAAASLHRHLRPLRLADPPQEIHTFALLDAAGDDLYDALSCVAGTLRSLAAINHSRDRSGFVEVPPRRAPAPAPPAPATAVSASAPATAPRPASSREDLLTSARTHFRPIRSEPADVARYADGDSFDIRGDLDSVEFQRSESGGVYYESALYLEYRTRSIDYGRLNLTAAQRCTLDEPVPAPRFRLRFPVRQSDAGVQTDAAAWPAPPAAATATAKKPRPSAMDSIWSAAVCAVHGRAEGGAGAAVDTEQLSREWEELLHDISAAHAEYARQEQLEQALTRADRKRRHSAALRSPPAAPGAPAAPVAACSHPHARFLHCCAAALDRPLTR